MNTIKKLSVEINKLDGLKICKLESSKESETLNSKLKCFVPMTTDKEKINLYKSYDNKLTRWIYGETNNRY